MTAQVPFTVPDSSLGGSLRHFDGRSVETIGFAQLVEEVVQARERLREAGVERGMLVGVIGENCRPWIVYDLALMSMGCVPVCFPADELAARPLDELARTHDLSLVVATAKAAGASAQPWVLVMNGSGPAAVRPATDNGLRRQIAGTGVCTVIFSSGTSGQLKALLLSRAGVEDVIATLAGDWQLGPGDGILVALPLSIFQQRLMVYAALRKDTDILLTDSANLFRSFKPLRPTIVLGPPALFESVERRFDALPPLRRRALMLLGAMLSVLPARWFAPLQRRLFADAHQAFGGRIRVLITGSAPSKRSTLRFYRYAGLPLFQAYGLAEVGFIAWNRPGRNRPATVGRPVVPGSVTLGDDGEVLVRLPHPQAVGYFGVDPAEQARTFLPDGRIATGDLGRFDARGYLHITGRKKNIILMQSGEKIQPEPIEALLALVPGVERAVLVGGGELPGLAAVVAIDPGASAQNEAVVRAQVQGVIDHANADARPTSRIGRLVVTRVVFRPETGLITRNLKLDRGAVARYFERELMEGPA